MKKLIIAVGVLMASVLSPMCHAQGPDPRNGNALTTFENTISAGSLLVSCQIPRGFEAGRCLGMVDGWVTAVTEFHPKGLTIAPNVTRLQVVRVFIAFMNKHPEMENEECYAGLGASLTDAKLLVEAK